MTRKKKAPMARALEIASYVVGRKGLRGNPKKEERGKTENHPKDRRVK